jgi:hypothetical protein
VIILLKTMGQEQSKDFWKGDAAGALAVFRIQTFLAQQNLWY